ncbi:hypothetical protein ACWGXJ_04320 [Paenibacillus sp. S33]
MADIGYREFLRGKTLIITGGRNKFMAFLPRLLPRKLMTNAVRSAQAKVER